MVSAYCYCIWYHVDASNAFEGERQVRGMMARLACRSGVAGQLMKKRDEPLLWMEYYPGVTDPDDFARGLEQLADEFDLAMFIAGPRHSECFVMDDEPERGCQTR